MEQTLTNDEIAYVRSMYHGCPDNAEGKLILKPLKYITDADIYMLCYWYDSVPFQGTIPSQWKIKREGLIIKVFCQNKGHAYAIDIHNGDVNILRGGMRSHLGTAAYAFQFYRRYHYAVPVFFEKGHWANGKTPFALGLAVPDLGPMHSALHELYDGDVNIVENWLFDKRLHNVNLDDLETYDRELTQIKNSIISKR